MNALRYISALSDGASALAVHRVMQDRYPLVCAAFVAGELDPALGKKHSDFLPSIEEIEAGVLVKEESDGGKIYELPETTFPLDILRVNSEVLLAQAKLGYVGNASPSFYYGPEVAVRKPTTNRFKVVKDRSKVFPWSEETAQPFTGADMRKIANLEQSHPYGLPQGCSVVEGKITGLKETSTFNWSAFQDKIRRGIEIKLPVFE